MTHTNTLRIPALIAGIALTAMMLLAGCAGLTQTERGAVIGAAGGAAVGGAVDRNTARGAIIGAAVGGAAGAVIGRQMDRRAEELDRDIDGATVERVGEGILVTFDSGILFDFDSAELRPAARTNLRSLANSLNQHRDSEVLIVGHTDSVGSAAYNQGLSERRASAAANYLAAQGVSRTRIRSVGRGLTEPVASNETEAGRQQNRRVEVAIFADEATRQRIQREQGE